MVFFVFNVEITLMEEILHHLEGIKHCKQWDKPSTQWFLPSTVFLLKVLQFKMVKKL